MALVNLYNYQYTLVATSPTGTYDPAEKHYDLKGRRRTYHRNRVISKVVFGCFEQTKQMLAKTAHYFNASGIRRSLRSACKLPKQPWTNKVSQEQVNQALASLGSCCQLWMGKFKMFTSKKRWYYDAT